ncbi:hypothetical protein [Pedobacter sp. R20-19]|uniref:hypothetical protein n=1 Tax=Pedobacter sp. R20-19 TaxID=1270196 RepID=UPI00049333A1|nr:hypothetical protein [Pedobacter sp. R20-19]
MEIKLNKELQNKMNLFLETKDEKLNEFLKKLGRNKYSFSKDEINKIENLYKKDRTMREYVFIYIERLL